MVIANETKMREFKEHLMTRCESLEDFKFILDLIEESESFPGFYSTPHNLDAILNTRNPKLVELFHSLSKELNISWSQTYPEDKETYLL